MHMLGILGILSQVETETMSNTQVSLFYLIWNATLAGQIVVILLIVASVVSWAIIGQKQRQLKNAKVQSARFLQNFWHAKTMEALINKGPLRKSPAFNIFKAGIDALRENPSPENSSIVEKEIQRATEDEIDAMEYGVPFLATTSTAAPFLGLFGTVWGILHAFWRIGRSGSSSMAVVGPNIAEALVTTALGLAAAIPAVIFYNMYVNKIRLVSKDLWDFSDDLMTRINREYYST